MGTLNCIPVSTGVTLQAENSVLSSGFAIPQTLTFNPKTSAGGSFDLSAAIAAEIRFSPLSGIGAGATKVRAINFVSGSASGCTVQLTEIQTQQIIADCNAVNCLYAIVVTLNTLDTVFVAQGLLTIQLLP